ncbi:hypothetical protein JCM8547_000053 [Rhodosporidiobolus lusitaniae]
MADYPKQADEHSVEPTAAGPAPGAHPDVSLLPSDPASRPVDFPHGVDPSLLPSRAPSLPRHDSLAESSPASGFPVDPSLLPPSFDSFLPLAGPGPSTLAHTQGGAYDLPVYPYDPSAAFGGGLADEYVLPVPPPLPGSASGRKDKGKKRARVGQDGIEKDIEVESELAGGQGKGKKRARSRSQSYYSSGQEDGEFEQEEEQDEDEDEEEEGSPRPSRRARRSTSASTRRAPAATSSKVPRPKAGTIASRIHAAGGLESIAGKRAKVKGVGGRKGVVLPLLPEMLRSAEKVEGDEEPSLGFAGEEGAMLEKEIARAKNPIFLTTLRASLASHEAYYDRAYQALHDELVKAQIEESVLSNVKRIVLERRDDIRYFQKSAATTTNA